MDQPVILSKLEQEYLLRALEGAVQVRELRQFFLWTQGQLQGLLPHQLMACMQFDEGGGLLRIDAMHGTVLAQAALRRLCDRHTGLAPRIAAHCAARQLFPCGAQGGASAPDSGAAQGKAAAPLAPFQHEIDACGYDNLLVHGSAGLPGGSTVFILFGLPQRPGARQAYFMELLLATMHMAWLRVAVQGARASGPLAAPGYGAATRRELGAGRLGGAVGCAGARALSARETEILLWLREGKSNADIAAIVGISALTVKNHLQRIYKNLAVGNRTQAVARSTALRLLPDGPLKR